MNEGCGAQHGSGLLRRNITLRLGQHFKTDHKFTHCGGA